MKKLVIIAVVISIFLLNLFLISAEENKLPIQPHKNPSNLDIFFNNINHLFSLQTFSVVGDNRACHGSADYTWTFQNGEVFSTFDNLIGTNYNGHIVQNVKYANCANKLYDVFSQGWTPEVEFRNNLFFECTNGYGPCNVEVYCCPTPEPSVSSDCPSGTTFTTENCPVDWTDINGNSVYKCPGENRIDYFVSSYNYCKLSSTDTMTCYYKSGTTCLSRTYSKSQFPNSCESYTYQSLPLFSSQSSCISSNCVPLWQTGPWGTCTNGGQTRQVTDSNNCNVNTNKPITFQNCGGTSPGTTTSCSGTTINQNGVCVEQSTICEKDGGTMNCDTNCDGECNRLLGYPIDSCISDCERDIKDNIVIYDVTYGGLAGEKLTSLAPGQSIRVTFKVKSSVNWIGNVPVLVEAGVIPLSLAQPDKWDMAQSSGFWSVFAIKESTKDACCLGQPNIADNKERLNTWGTETIHDFEYIIQIPDKDIIDVCNMGNVYWDPASDQYLLYVTAKNGCYKDGYRSGIYATKVLTININESSSIGKKCDNDFQCEAGEKCMDIKGDYNPFQKYCSSDGTLKSDGGLTEIKKISLTREEITTATDNYLFASACYKPNECLPMNDEEGNAYTIKCNSLQSLVNDGTLTVQQKDSFFKSAQSTIAGAGIGAGVGFTVCSVGAWIAAAGATAATSGAAAVPAATFLGVAVPTLCAGGGALTGAALGNIFSSKDSLVAGINAADANKVGVCTAEPNFNYCKYTSWAGFITIPGMSKCTSGLIIILVGLGLIILIFKGSKK